MSHKILILHNIRSAQNIGAMFRTSEAIGVDKIILSGYSATPTDRFGRPEKKIIKSALGSEKLIEWQYSENIENTLGDYKEKGYRIAAVEQTSDSVDYKDYSPQENQIIIMGNEVDGVEEGLLMLADDVLELPMKGEKESLNVATCCGIVLYRLFDC